MNCPGSLEYARFEVFVQEPAQELAVKKRPMVIICPGGAYAYTSPREAEPVAYKLMAEGYNCGILYYSCAPAKYPVALTEAASCFRIVRKSAAAWKVDKNAVLIMGFSAGGHLAAVAALKCNAKVFVGYSGIYDLTTAAITTRAKDPERIAYFGGLKDQYLKDASPIFMIPKKSKLAAQLYCGTGDLTVECTQSEMFASELKRHKAKVDLQEYKYYDHNLSSKTSDKMEEIFFKTVDFVVENL